MVYAVAAGLVAVVLSVVIFIFITAIQQPFIFISLLLAVTPLPLILAILVLKFISIVFVVIFISIFIAISLYCCRHFFTLNVIAIIVVIIIQPHLQPLIQQPIAEH